MLLHEVISGPLEEWAAKRAVIDAGTTYSFSYEELSCRAEDYETAMRRLGFLPGRRVGFIARKSVEMIAAFLGALRAGVVYVPLDPQASYSYWNLVLKELNIQDVISDVPGVSKKLGDVRVYALDPSVMCDGGTTSFLYERDDVRGEVVSPDRLPEDDAFVLATSGSTGRPKGVLISHENALAFVRWASEEVGLCQDDKLLSVAPFHFDLSVFDIYAGLSCGAKVVLAPGLATIFPGQLISTIEDYKISVLYCVPTVLRMLVKSDAFRDGAGCSLRTIIFAGEPFPAQSLRKLMEMLQEVTFYNFFGPTETNVCLAHRLIELPDPMSEIPIGRPASGARITLVDESGALVKPGGIGEILVNGPSVMKGYLKADGFHQAERPFATGDFAQLGADGNFYFRGRRDQQVKVRGARVELATVEAALMASEGVVEAVALVINQDLVAFVSCEGDMDKKTLCQTCAQFLPPGAVPHKFVSVVSLPRLSNGKLDLVALKALAAS